MKELELWQAAIWGQYKYRDLYQIKQPQQQNFGELLKLCFSYGSPKIIPKVSLQNESWRKKCIKRIFGSIPSANCHAFAFSCIDARIRHLWSISDKAHRKPIQKTCWQSSVECGTPVKFLPWKPTDVGETWWQCRWVYGGSLWGMLHLHLFFLDPFYRFAWGPNPTSDWACCRCRIGFSTPVWWN